MPRDLRGTISTVQHDPDRTREAAIHNSGYKFETLSAQQRWIEAANVPSEKSSEATRLSHKVADPFGPIDDGNPSFEFEDASRPRNPDMNQEEQDLLDIQRLQQRLDLMNSRVTIKDISNLSAIGKSQRGSQNMEKEFYQMSMRPTMISNLSQKKQVDALQKQIQLN